MCGIVAYVGNKPVDSVLMVGLTRLEYRGYDSAGIAAIDKGELVVRKQKGKIKELDNLLRSQPVEGGVGIGHTRWATHGEPSRLNAHPHIDTKGKIAVVHNGIIENHTALRAELIGKGHIFKTETDTEVIPHLLEDELRKGCQVSEALQSVLLRLEGKYAFAFIFEGESDRIYFARNGSPLIFGRGDNESFLASDVSAIIPAAKEQLMLENEHWGWITKEGLHLFNGTGKPLPFTLTKIKLTVDALDKGGFDHFMLKEIYEQPAILRRIIDERTNHEGDILFPEMKLSNEHLGKVSRIIIASAGTSWHAALEGKLYLERFARIVTDVDVSSEFRYRNPIAEGDSLMMAISQSGETADTLAGIHEAKAKFLKVISFVNNTHSTIARESDAYVGLLAGPEIGVASTKAYTAQVLSMLLFAIHMASVKWMISKEERIEIFKEIRKLPEYYEHILSRADIIKGWAKELRDARDFIFLGRNYNHPTALEGALKLKEISYVHASGYAGGEFKHGPIALITEHVPCVAIAPQTEVYEKMLSNIEEVRARKGKIIAICTEGDTKVPEISDYHFCVPAVPDFLTPLLTVVPLQLLSYYMALEKGCEPDQPRNLAKSVTVE